MSVTASIGFCEDVIKCCFKETVKDALFLSKTIRSKHLLRRIFEKLCEERMRKAYAMVLYSKTR